jgi:hypothetical protein
MLLLGYLRVTAIIMIGFHKAMDLALICIRTFFLVRIVTIAIMMKNEAKSCTSWHGCIRT